MAALLYARIENGAVAERMVIDMLGIPAHKSAMWKPVVFVGKDDAVDPIAQVKVGPVTTITATEVVDTWTVRAKTQAELDADAVAVSTRVKDSVENVTGKVLFKMMNAIRVLQGQAPFTPAQFRTWFEAQQ